jgi:hypothetical protein
MSGGLNQFSRFKKLATGKNNEYLRVYLTCRHLSIKMAYDFRFACPGKKPLNLDFVHVNYSDLTFVMLFHNVLIHIGLIPLFERLKPVDVL